MTHQWPQIQKADRITIIIINTQYNLFNSEAWVIVGITMGILPPTAHHLKSSSVVLKTEK